MGSVVFKNVFIIFEFLKGLKFVLDNIVFIDLIVLGKEVVFMFKVVLI